MICFGSRRAPNLPTAEDADTPCVCFLTFDEMERNGKALGIAPAVLRECMRTTSSKLERYEGCDLISLFIPRVQDSGKQATYTRVCIYMHTNLLVFVCDVPHPTAFLINRLCTESVETLGLSHLLYSFLDRITADDTAELEAIEQQIWSLEEALMESPKQDYLHSIMQERQKLMYLKRYYEQLVDVAEALEDNENRLLSHASLRYFRILTNRCNRLYHAVLNLRDYATQVREAYQAQVDIGLNSLMKLFTVITAIFSPLTLIVGWYGMNLKMPEFGWQYGYPFVIVLSIAVVVVCVILFKRNKWF